MSWTITVGELKAELAKYPDTALVGYFFSGYAGLAIESAETHEELGAIPIET